MNLEKIYHKNINRTKQEIKEITEDFELKTNLKNFYIKNNIIILICFIITILLIFFAFSYSLKAMLSVFFLLILISILSIWFNSFSIIKKENEFIVKTNIEEIKIDVNKIRNIYLEENYYRIFLKKRKSYTLVILYETPNKNIFDIKLNTSLLLETDIQNMFSKIILKDEIVNNQEKYFKYKRKRILKKLLLFAIIMIIAIIALKVYQIFY